MAIAADRKPRWERIPLDIVRQHPTLLAEMLERRRELKPWRPYICGSEIRFRAE